MSNSGNTQKNETIREILGTAMTSDWQNLGGPISHRAFTYVIQNTLNQDVYLSRTSDPQIDGVVQPTMRSVAQSSRIIDLKTNDSVEGLGTQFQVMWAGTPPENKDGVLSFEVAFV